MVSSRFWLAARVHLQTLEYVNIHESELNSVSFDRTGATCHLTPEGFVRVARQLGIRQLQFSKDVMDQPYFIHSEICFVCVCSEDVSKSMSDEFEMVCVDDGLLPPVLA